MSKSTTITNSPPVKGGVPEGGRGLLPKLRFPEFEDEREWREKTLIDVGKIITGKTPSTMNKDFWGGDILFITPTDISEERKYQVTTQRKITKQKETKILPIGAIVYTCIASIGKIAITKSRSSTNQQINSIVVKDNISNEYIYYALVNLTPYIKSMPATSTLPIINKTEFSKFEIIIPKKEEQQKIADCLSSLDDLITAYVQRHDALKAHKKGLMQQLFPATGEITPKLRFPEFKNAGAWDEKTIGETTQVVAGATPSTSNPEYWNGDIPWMNSGELNQKRIHRVSNRITSLGLKKSSTKIIPFGCILIGLAGQGKTRGTAAINYIELCTNQSIVSILPNNNKFVSEFLFHKIDSMYNYLRGLSKGDGGRGGLNLQIIKSVEILFPSLDEQQKIADCLSSIDDLITVHTQKHDALKAHKKGLMQQLFPENKGVRK